MSSEQSTKLRPYWTRSGYRGEYNCIHGVGHGKHIHGCDGCCSLPDFPLNDNNIDCTRAKEAKVDGHPVVSRSSIPVADHDGCRFELDPGILDRACDDEEVDAKKVGLDDG